MKPPAHGLSGRSVDAFAVLVRIRMVDQVGLWIVDADAHVRVVEDLADLVADRVVDALDVELGRERGLHAVDDRQLGGALLGLLEQPLRLVEEARVLQRDAHARGDRAEQAHLRLAEGVLALVVLEDDRRRGRDRCRGSGTRTIDMRRIGAVQVARVRARCLLGECVDNAGLARSDDRLARAAGHLGGSARQVQALAVLVFVEVVIRLVAGSYQRMPMSPVLNTSRSLSPTRSTMAWKSSSAAMPCWMLLITASSAARCSVSLSRRCVSSKRRAFSSATPMLAATVLSRRTSASPKAYSRS